MKTLVSFIISLILTSSVHGETFTIPGSMVCDSNGSIIKQIADEYNEKPIIIGQSSNGVKMAVLYNEKTKTWTILGLKENVTCILGAGTDLQILINDKRIKYYVVY